MIKSVSALLFGASLLAAAPASAGRYIAYNLASRGSGELVTGGYFGTPIVRSTIYNANLSFLIDTQDSAYLGGYTATSYGTMDTTAGRSTSLSISDNILSFRSSATSGINKSPMVSLSGSACGSFPNGLAGPITIGQNCSSLNVDFRSVDYMLTFTGDVAAISISTFDDASQLATRGFAYVSPGVPEPATWAMMLVGFAMTGAAMRHRRRIRAVL